MTPLTPDERESINLFYLSHFKKEELDRILATVEQVLEELRKARTPKQLNRKMDL